MSEIYQIKDKQTREFAIACNDQNSIEELREEHTPDKTDMEIWGITEEQWRQAINTTLNERLNDEEV